MAAFVICGGIMHIPRIMLAAAHKSSGKTTVALGLAAAFRARGLDVRMFKKGPDYIDPLWHRLASERASYNLDFNTQEHDEILSLFTARGAGADICLIEANKGLYDGLDLEGRDSNAALAALLKAPVVLVIDTVGMTRGIAPLLKGYEAFAEGIDIAGVILNRVGGPRHEAKLVAAVERYTDMPVLGSVPRERGMELKERHLGLTTPGDMAALQERLAAIGARVAEGVDLRRLREIASKAPALAPAGAKGGETAAGRGSHDGQPASGGRRPDVRIAVARDAAFCFYYPDDLEQFAAEGAELVFFSPTTDRTLPADIDGLFLGGGFPETHMTALAANRDMREAIARAIAGGLPAYAECGGLMYLAQSIAWAGERAEMCGIVPARAVMNARPQGRGIIHLETRAEAPWPVVPPGRRIRAHEFHYASLHGVPGDSRFAWRVRRGHGISGDADGLIIGNLVAGFAHLRHTRQSPWVSAFVNFVRERAGTRR
jgi:cobyrinic acid a,c-diamide synthase